LGGRLLGVVVCLVAGRNWGTGKGGVIVGLCGVFCVGNVGGGYSRLVGVGV